MASNFFHAQDKEGKSKPEEKQVKNQRSATSETPRDGQNSQPGKTAASKKRRYAPSSPGAANGGEAWPQLGSDPICCGLTPDQSGRSWPRFVVVEAFNPDEPLSKLSPWAIQKGFSGISASIKNVKRMGKTGAYLIECPDEKTSKHLLVRNATMFIDRKIKVTPHRTLNTCRGVITVKDSDVHEHLAEGLKDQGVTNVHRVSRGGEPTNTFFLTFGMPKPPEFIVIPTFLSRFRVRAFVPRPLQCFNCWRFGHPQGKCQADKICRLCGLKAHEGSCPSPAKCGNCKGQHGPADKQCPTYVKEATIQRIRAERGISFGEAKKVVEATDPPNGRSFADAAATAGQKTPAQLPQTKASTQPRRDPLKVQSSNTQFGDELPKALHLEALALARDLLEELRAKGSRPRSTKDASAQFAAEAQNKKKKKQTKSATPAAKAVKQTFGSATLAAKAAKQAQGSAEQVPKPANTSSQAKPGEASAPPPKNAEAKQAEGPALGKRGGNAPAQAPQAAAGIPGKPIDTPAGRSGGASGSALKPAALPTSGKGDTSGFALKAPTLNLGHGVAVKTTEAKQKEGTALDKKQGVTPAPAPQAAAGNHTPHSPMEVAHPPAPAHQAAGGRAPSSSPSGRGALSSIGAKIGEMFGGRASAATKPKEKKKWRSASHLIGTKSLSLLDREQPLSLENSFDPLGSLSDDQPLPKPPLYPFERASEENPTEWG